MSILAVPTNEILSWQSVDVLRVMSDAKFEQRYQYLDRGVSIVILYKPLLVGPFYQFRVVSCPCPAKAD